MRWREDPYLLTTPSGQVDSRDQEIWQPTTGTINGDLTERILGIWLQFSVFLGLPLWSGG